jgi:hydrogenase maturation protein HypF
LEFRDRHGTHTHISALQAAAEAIRSGKIVAAKGLGGFHLLTPARDEGAVCRLRERKHREEKPLALMFPSLELVRECCLISAAEERLLRSPEAPIVLLRRADRENGRPANAIAPSVAPGNPYLGVMLPYTPMHHLLLSLLRFPVVATSGNLSDEPICIDEHDARERLKGIADAYLVHNRPIARHVDDSIVRLIAGREMILRRARGYAPLPVSPGTIPIEAPPVLAVGAHLKNAIAVSSGPDIFVSQHIGDLETDEAYEAFRRVVSDLETLYEVEPAVVAADAHPDYLSSKFAREQTRAGRGGTSGGMELFSVQHHLAHVLSCMAENALRPPLLGVAWDGTGYGLDGTVWGGEFFVVAYTSWARFGHLRQFPLPGGDQAIKEPRRSALGLLFAAFGERAFASDELPPLKNFSPAELGTLKTMLQRKVNSPLTSSAGRVFDAVSSLAGLRQQVRFEGQAAMELEFAVEGVRTDEAYPIELSPPNRLAAPWIVDWAPLLDSVLGDLRRGVRLGLISARFHNALVEAIVMVARQAGHSPVALSGGCFQNRYLTERAIRRLEEEGFRPYWHQRVPPNDGGIALGQVLAAIRR